MNWVQSLIPSIKNNKENPVNMAPTPKPRIAVKKLTKNILVFKKINRTPINPNAAKIKKNEKPKAVTMVESEKRKIESNKIIGNQIGKNMIFRNVLNMFQPFLS